MRRRCISLVGLLAVVCLSLIARYAISLLRFHLTHPPHWLLPVLSPPSLNDSEERARLQMWKWHHHAFRAELASNAQIQVEDVTFGDGVTGWWVRRALPDGEVRTAHHVVVTVHGLGNSRLEFVSAVPALLSIGADVLLFDCHGVGESPRWAGTNAGVTYGVREALDVRNAIEFVWSRPSVQRVSLMGMSAGAAAALKAMMPSDDPLVMQKKASAVVLMAPFASFVDAATDIVLALLSNIERLHGSMLYGMVSRIIIWSRNRRGILRGLCTAAESVITSDCDAGDCVLESPLATAHVWNRSVLREQRFLIVHGDHDHLVPMRHSKELHEAIGDKSRICIATGVGHNTEDLFNSRCHKLILEHLQR